MKLKSCDASLRVFKTLIALMDGAYSIQEILMKFWKEAEDDAQSYTNETILKYINTLKVYGVKLNREKDKYSILNCPASVELDSNDLRGFYSVLKYSLPDNDSQIEVANLMSQLEKWFSKFTNERMAQISFSKEKVGTINNSEHDMLKKYIKDKLLLKLETKQGETFICKPIEVVYGEQNVYFRIYIPSKLKKYDIDQNDIKCIEQLSTLASESEQCTGVTFRLIGRLAKSYQLRNGEKVVKVEEDGRIISLNCEESENILLKRLMRYGELCEIVAPADVRELMQKQINDMIVQYE